MPPHAAGPAAERVLGLLDSPPTVPDLSQGYLDLIGNAPRPAGALTARADAAARLIGLTLFGPEEITGALAERGFTCIKQRVVAIVQFIGGELPAWEPCAGLATFARSRVTRSSWWDRPPRRTSTVACPARRARLMARPRLLGDLTG